MDENKQLNNTPEGVCVAEDNSKKHLKNTLRLKKGGYSIILTAIVLVAIIVFNILVSALADRFVLEFDMTADKENSISEENIEYIKSIDREVEIIICATKETYVDYVDAVAQSNYSVQADETMQSYFAQTVKLIEKYNAYNGKLNVSFMDTQSSEFTAIASEYGTENLEAGGIIVSAAREDGTKRVKKLGVSDIYVLQEDSTYASYGIVTNTITANNIETALTSAVAYVLSDKDVTVAVYTGHSDVDLTESYIDMLKKNNYTVEVVSDGILGKIDTKYDMLAIPVPTKDFVETELNEIAAFLKNDGGLEKGLVVFADATAPYLEGLYTYLSEWGIEISDGVLFETSDGYYSPDDPTTFVSENSGSLKDLANLEMAITGNNVPMKTLFEEKSNIKTVTVAQTLDTCVKAPKGATAGWNGAKEAEKGPFAVIAESTMTEYTDDGKTEINSTVTVFSSSYFLESEYNEQSSVSNKNFALAMTDRAVDMGETGISFVSKSLTNESYYDSVSEASVNAVKTIFMFIIPLAVLAVGVVIFIKRRNA